jgi:hypothetical protein
MLYIQRITKKVIFAAEFKAIFLLLVDLPVIKFSGAYKICAISKILGREYDAVSSNANAIFSPPLVKEKHLEISYTSYMLHNCKNLLMLTKERKGSTSC